MSEDDEALGAIAQLGERLVCNQKVTGSIPVGSTILRAPNNLQSRVFCAPWRGVRSLTIRKFFCFNAHVQAMNTVD
jgi:hypothetical protein